MAFVWISINKGQIVTAQVYSELQTNLDYVDDTKCLSHYEAVDSHDSVDSYDSAFDSHDSPVDSYDSSVKTYDIVDGSYHYPYYAGYNHPVYADYDTSCGVCNSYCGSVNGTVYSNYHEG